MVRKPRQVKFAQTSNMAKDSSVQDAGDPDTTTVILHTEGIGSSGVRNFSGYPSEEYLQSLRGHMAADIFDKMRRQESEIKMVLSAVQNPIMDAKWDIEPGDDSADAQMIADFIEHVLFSDMDKSWDQFVKEALTCVPFGFAVFELLDKVVLNHPTWGSYNGIKSIAFRSPRTIYRWNLDKATGKLASVTQIAFGDLQRLVEIPAPFLMVVTIDQEGDSYEGISMLRAAYGPFFRKQNYLKLMAIGIEKFAVPTPIGRIPNGKQNTEEAQNLITALQIYSNHEQNYITLPASPPNSGGWDIELKPSSFDPEKVQKAIDAEDKNIVKSFLAQFLELGMTTSGGSWALAFNQSDFFLSAIEHIAKLISGRMNQGPIKRLVDLNFGPQAKYPKLVHYGVSDKAGKELSETLKNLADSQVIIPDDELEGHIRQRYRFPKASIKGRRQVVAKGAMGEPGAPLPPADPNPPTSSPVQDDDTDAPDGAPQRVSSVSILAKKIGSPTSPGTANPSLPQTSSGFGVGALSERYRKRLSFAETTAKSQISQGSQELQSAIRDGLSTIHQAYVSQIMAAWKKAPPSAQPNAAKGLVPNGISNLKSSLTQVLTNIAARALDQARREVPKAKNVKLSERGAWVKVGDARILLAGGDDYSLDYLPPEIRTKIKNKGQILSDSLVNDLEKAVTFQFDASEASTDSPSILEGDIQDAGAKFIEDSSNVIAAAGNAAAHAVNDTRNAFFFDDDTLDEIESFTFTNGDPVSEICQDLAGTTFDTSDPEASRYFPPLHHNCKSYLTPNLVGAKKNPDLTPGGLKPSDPELDDQITLSATDAAQLWKRFSDRAEVIST